MTLKDSAGDNLSLQTHSVAFIYCKAPGHGVLQIAVLSRFYLEVLSMLCCVMVLLQTQQPLRRLLKSW